MMKQGKRLWFILLLALVMVAGSAALVYADPTVVGGVVFNGSQATINDEDGTGHGTVEIKAPENTVYNGGAKAAAVTGSFYGTDITPGLTDRTLQYGGSAVSIIVGYVTTGQIYYEGETLAGNEYTKKTTAPREAGSYTATMAITVEPYGGNPIEGSIKVEYDIEPKTIEVTWTDNSPQPPADAWTYYYDGESHAPTAKVASKSLVEGDEVFVSVSGAAKTVATHTATAELNGPDAANYVIDDATEGGEYVGSKKQEFTIAPKPITVTWKGVNGSDEDFDFTYNGEEQGPTCTIDSNQLIKGESCTLTVSGQQKDVGIYDGGQDEGHGPAASAELSNDNYVIAETDSSSATQAFTIQVFTIIELDWSPDTFEYNADYQCPEATVEPVDDQELEDGDCDLTYNVHKDTKDGEVVEPDTKMPVGTYWAEAILPESEKNFKFADETDRYHKFTVTQKVVKVTLSIEDRIYYDGKYHKPEITVDGIYDDVDDCRPVVSLTGLTMDGVTVNLPDIYLEEEKGVIHASSGKYTATVVELVSDDDSLDYANYKLEVFDQVKFEILPKPVSLDWYRPAYNEYGDEMDEDPPVLVDVEGGEKLNLVFNGKVQAPVAQIRKGMLETSEETGEKDECTITVSAPSNAIEARPSAYKVQDIQFGNPDYTRDKSGADYYIIARPVKLTWDKTETTYNGLEQQCTPSITNIQKNDRGQNYSAGDGIGVVEVSSVIYVPGYHFGTQNEVTDEADSTFNRATGYHNDDGTEQKGLAEGTIIDAANRTPIDAGTYVMTAAELSDPFNYTLVRINPESVELEPAVIPDTQEPAYVANHHPIYTIHQYGIQTIDWSNTKVTYNASNQKPVAKVNKSDLQGPDTNEQVIVMIHDDPDAEEEESFVGHCNAGTYTIHVLKGEYFRGIKGDRSANYFIAEGAQKMNEKFTINKKALTVTVNDQAISYGDDPATIKNSIRYSGLINGKVNTDDNHNNTNVPGKYTPEGKTEAKDVVEGTPTYKASYSKWGKPGMYTISVSGLTSDNYAITYKAGKLTVRDKVTALLAKAKAGSKKGTLYWNGVTGAAKYDIYYSHCNTPKKTFTPKYYKTVSGNKTSTKIKKLKKRNFYKFYVVAFDSSGKQIAQSDLSHFCTSNVSGKYTNPKSIKASATNVTVSKGGTFKLSAKVKKVKKGKKLVNGIHTTKIRYKSEVPAVATVTPDGTITGVGTGWCRVYVLAANGIWQTVEVNVQ